MDPGTGHARPASWRHVPLAFVVFFRSFRGNMVRLPFGHRTLDRYLLDRVARGEMWVARGGLSFACVEVEPDGTWFVAWVAAWPRGRGHGSSLLKGLAAEADARRVELALHAPRDASSWYARFGFRPAVAQHRPRPPRERGLVTMTRPPCRTGARSPH